MNCQEKFKKINLCRLRYFGLANLLYKTQTEPQLSTISNSPVEHQVLENDKNDLDDSLPETTALVLSSASASSSYADVNDGNTSVDATVSKQTACNQSSRETVKTNLKEKLINDYPDVFQNNIHTTNLKHNTKHHIITSGPPVKSRLRPLSPEKLAFVKKENNQSWKVAS